MNKYSREDIEDIEKYLNHGLTVRGNLVAECIMYYGKKVELRKKKIKNKKYLALHLGSGKINSLLKQHLIKHYIPDYNEKKYNLKKGHIVAIMKMGESKHLNELPEDKISDKWLFSEGEWKVCNFIEKVYILNNPIKSRGFQSMTWNLECVDNHLKKKKCFEERLKEKIIKELYKQII